MRVGIDFDNTIVSYDTLFHRVAREQGLIPDGLPMSKVSVRDHLRREGKENLWTEMQGYVYGARMDEAAMYPGVRDFLQWARTEGLAVAIVSHKTRRPFLGPQYDLHAAARAWVEHHLQDESGPLLAPRDVYFELTKEEKIARIRDIGCTHFIDDLPEILLAPDFPSAIQRILFDPEGHHAGAAGLHRVGSWSEIHRHFESKWVATQ